MSQSDSAVKKELHLLKYIIDDVNRDVGTQTLHTKSSRDKTRSRKVATDDTTASRVHKYNNSKTSKAETSSNTNFKSSFRLFIVPDEESDDANHALRLSLDGHHTNSFRLSMTSSKDDASNSKIDNRSKKNRKTQIHSSLNGAEKEKGMMRERSKTSERDNLMEHRLIHSRNPSVVAWLKFKNFEESQKRKAKKRENRDMKRIEREEQDKRKKRELESEKKFVQWLRAKKKEAKRAWREHRASTQVCPAETIRDVTINDDDAPPPNYTAVPSFIGAQFLNDQGLDTTCVTNATSTVTNANNQTTKPDMVLQKTKRTKRPRTSGPVRERNNTTHGSLESRPNTANGQLNGNSGKQKTEVANGITYDAWRERKRREDKEKTREKKREVDDDALTEAILKFARRRTEYIKQRKKEVDTGIPKWRARNRVKCKSGDASTETPGIIHREYALRTDLEEQSKKQSATELASYPQSKNSSENQGHDISRGLEELEAIRKFCENIELEDSTNEPRGLNDEP